MKKNLICDGRYTEIESGIVNKRHQHFVRTVERRSSGNFQLILLTTAAKEAATSFNDDALQLAGPSGLHGIVFLLTKFPFVICRRYVTPKKSAYWKPFPSSTERGPS